MYAAPVSMQASSTDMLTNAEPRLITISDPVSRISAAVAATSRASSWRACSFFDSSLMWPLRLTLSMIASHFDTVRDAMQMSPSTSLCIAALWAATWATPPAPMINTFFFIADLLATTSCA